MRDGNISNLSSPYVAFDFNCALFVPKKHLWKVKLFEFFKLHYKASRYYQVVPKTKKVLDMLMRVNYNIMFVYIGHRAYWKSKMFMLNFFGIPFTALNCVARPMDFNETIVRQEEVLVYSGLSAIAVQAAGNKGRLFDNWDAWLMFHVGIQPGAVSQEVFSKGGGL